MHRVRRMVAPLIIVIRMAVTITVPATETTVRAIRAITTVPATTVLSIPATRAITTGQVEILVRTIAPATTARATIIVLTTVTVLTIAPIIAPDITIRTGHPVRVIVPV